MRAAAAHFLKDGFERTSMDRIAAGAKVSKQAIYELFLDKENLFDTVVRGDIATGKAVQVPACDSVMATLAGVAENLFEGFVSPRNMGLFRANIVAMRRFPKLAADLHAYRRAQSQMFATYLEGQVAAGQIAPIEGSSVDLATRLGAMAVEGARYFLGYKIPAKAERQEMATLAAQVYGCGMFSGGGAAGPFADQPAYDPVCPEPPATVRMRMPQERFDALCDAAADEFLAQGFEGANIDAIAAASGTGRATIYRHFGGKAGLFAYVIEREIAGQWRDIAMPQAASAQLQTEKLCRLLLDLHLDPRSLALYYLLVQESDQFPALARLFYDMQIDRAARPFRQIAAAAGMQGVAPIKLRMFHTLAVYGVRYVVSRGTVDAAERELVSRQAATIVWHGITGTTARQFAQEML